MKIENTTTDAVLVTQYLKGDESGLEVLITRHKQRIYSFIYSRYWIAM
ncbi:RNA polymerase sigma-70 factor [Nonlabens ulvanivorans]|uniref:RNA polymerase sigma-70 factor n=1 Tax=Nonlabens ulvanivorans TaxID=906888 RepID=A0A090QIC4_NONUL|nr:RNA polymerase sigma-70 factor [Nonlabens ulvanivorans]